MSQIKCFVFAEIPHAHPTWSVAVMAVGEKDARAFMRASHHGGKLISKPQPGATVKASCGATTEAAQVIMHARLEAENAYWDELKAAHPDWSFEWIARMVSDRFFEA